MGFQRSALDSLISLQNQIWWGWNRRSSRSLTGVSNFRHRLLAARAERELSWKGWGGLKRSREASLKFEMIAEEGVSTWFELVHLCSYRGEGQLMIHMSLSTPLFFAGKRGGMTLLGVDEAILNSFIALLMVYPLRKRSFGLDEQERLDIWPFRLSSFRYLIVTHQSFWCLLCPAWDWLKSESEKKQRRNWSKLKRRKRRKSDKVVKRCSKKIVVTREWWWRLKIERDLEIEAKKTRQAEGKKETVWIVQGFDLRIEGIEKILKDREMEEIILDLQKDPPNRKLSKSDSIVWVELFVMEFMFVIWGAGKRQVDRRGSEDWTCRYLHCWDTWDDYAEASFAARDLSMIPWRRRRRMRRQENMQSQKWKATKLRLQECTHDLRTWASTWLESGLHSPWTARRTGTTK